MLEANFFATAIFGAFGGDCAEGLAEDEPNRFGHYVGGEVFGDVDKLGCLVGCEVGGEVFTLADGSPCGLDRVVEEVGALVVLDVVGFCDFAREIVAEDLLEVLSVVSVGARNIGECDGCHSVLSFRPLVLILYHICPGLSRGFGKFFEKIF